MFQGMNPQMMQMLMQQPNGGMPNMAPQMNFQQGQRGAMGPSMAPPMKQQPPIAPDGGLMGAANQLGMFGKPPTGFMGAGQNAQPPSLQPPSLQPPSFFGQMLGTSMPQANSPMMANAGALGPFQPTMYGSGSTQPGFFASLLGNGGSSAAGSAAGSAAASSAPDWLAALMAL